MAFENSINDFHQSNSGVGNPEDVNSNGIKNSARSSDLSPFSKLPLDSGL